jgi:uncharacterized protein (TIGR02646 family)
MRKLERGAAPAGLAGAAKVELAAAQLHFENTGAKDGFEFNAYRRIDVRAALKAFGIGKCAYCEADYDATHPEDIEHYRPKGAIATDAGRLKPGYWWLAADWHNLLPSCIRCNRVETQPLYDGSELKMGKGERFPLADETKRASTVGAETFEAPLLIDPCREDPSAFIRFVDDNGACIAVPVDPDPTSLRARRARASIDIYGLNRAGLVRDRSRYTRRAKAAVLNLRRLARLEAELQAGPAHLLEAAREAIREELLMLDELTCGTDRYTGMITTLVAPDVAHRAR